jgi:SHS2 domain-containing protein
MRTLDSKCYNRCITMNNFEIIDTTADVGIRAFSADWPSLYVNAAMGMLSLITDIKKIEERLTREISIIAPDRETLLAGWLNELIYLFDAEMLLFCRFEIVKIGKSQLKARCFGEKADRSRHEIKRGIKSATYHKLKVEKMKDGSYMAEMIFDI